MKQVKPMNEMISSAQELSIITFLLPFPLDAPAFLANSSYTGLGLKFEHFSSFVGSNWRGWG